MRLEVVVAVRRIGGILQFSDLLLQMVAAVDLRLNLAADIFTLDHG
ncbi:hypothetical protein ALO78_200438 [Pseudomonas amygdali pv. ciccaronei]|nr:hypothetical protein ALO78_200438 [Pseudomonas amygdali pv. ciccaronei]